MHFLKAAVLLLVLGVLSCNSQTSLEVRPTHLRNLELLNWQQPMIRGEKQRLLYGAIGVQEQQQRLGHYYVIVWNNEEIGEPAKVVFEYRQASTGSKVLRQTADFDASTKEGRAEFKVIGDTYLKGGRVLAWRCRLFRGDREVASRHSYLWD